MFKRKKILSLCCALILLISMATPAAFAEDGPQRPPQSVSYPDTVFSVDSIEVTEGQIFEFTVSVTNNHGLCGYSITLEYDTSAFTFVNNIDGKSVSPIVRGSFANRGSITSNYDLVSSGENSVLNITYYSTSEVPANDGTMCIIRLQAKSENIAGTYPVSLSYTQNSTLQWDDWAASTEGKGRFPTVADIQCVSGEIVVGHDWDEGVQVPSLTIPDPAVIDTLYTCKVCGETHRELGYDPHHWEITENVAPTCTADGHINYKCADCELTRTEVVPALGHTWGDWTRVDDNTHSRTCSVCHTVETAEHDYRIVHVPATCTQTEKIVYTCKDCGYSHTENGEPALGHEYESTVVAPTCTEAGYTLYQCVRCDDFHTEPGAPATGHSFGPWTRLVTATTDAGGNFVLVTDPENHQRRCTNCTERELAPHNFTPSQVAPTCTEAGYTQYTCSDCGYYYRVETAPATGHTYVSSVTAPTCTQAGYTTYTCTVCGDSYRVTGEPATGHTYGEWTSLNTARHQRRCIICDAQQTASHNFTVTETAPTCTEDGSRVSVCSDCGETITRALPATGHRYVRVTTAPTCTEAGYVTYTCSVCGDSYVEAGDPATGHSWGEWTDNGTNHIRRCANCDATETGEHAYETVTTPPTCTEAGQTTHKCSVCGKTYTEAGAPATGHSFGAWESVNGTTHTRHCANCDVTETANHNLTVTETAPTCTEPGSRTTRCADCGYTSTEAIPATGHSFGNWTDNGTNHIRTCANCDATETAEHTFTVTEKAPTCTETGLKTSTCSVCGHKDEETIPALGHNYTSVVTEPTCTEAGYTTFTCTRCGDSYTEPGAPATGHTFGAWESLNNESHTRKCANCDATETAAHNFTVVEVAPTAETNGSRTYTCSDCGFVKVETIPMTGHNYVPVETPPTCTEDGYITYTCTDCGDSYVNPGAPALGHDFGEWTDNGANHTRACSRCDVTETAEHTFTVTEIAPTCTETGLKTSTCSVCGHKDEEVIPALGHDYTSVVTEPTCTEAGYTTFTCTRCGDSYTEPGAPALGHNYVETVVPPTETEGGYTLHECSRCGDSYKDNFTDPIGSEPHDKKGDVDFDGDIDNVDLILIARHLVRIITFTERQLKVADMNDDGTVNNADLILHARLLVGLG